MKLLNPTVFLASSSAAVLLLSLMISVNHVKRAEAGFLIDLIENTPEDVDWIKILGLDTIFKRIRKSKSTFVHFPAFIFDPKHPVRSLSSIFQNSKSIEALDTVVNVGKNFHNRATKQVENAKIMASLLPFIPVPVPIPAKAGEVIANAAAEALGSLTANAGKALGAAASAATNALPAVTQAPHAYLNPAASLLLNSPWIPINPLKLEPRALAEAAATEAQNQANLAASSETHNLYAQNRFAVPSDGHSFLGPNQFVNPSDAQSIFSENQFVAPPESHSILSQLESQMAPQVAPSQIPIVPVNDALLRDLIQLAALEEAAARVASFRAASLTHKAFSDDSHSQADETQASTGEEAQVNAGEAQSRSEESRTNVDEAQPPTPIIAFDV